MHFIVHNKKELSKKVALNVKTVERNTLVSSLSNIKLEVFGSELRLTSFDGNNCVVSRMDIENISGCKQSIGSVLIDSVSFKNIVDRLTMMKSETMEFKLLEDSSEMIIKSNRTKLKVRTVLDTTDFDTVPSLYEFDTFRRVSFNKEDIAKAVSKVVKCSSKDNTKPILEAVNFVINDNLCDVVCLDGYRLALNVLSCESSEDFTISISATKLKSILDDISSSTGERVELKTNGKYTLIQSGDINIFIREIEGSLAPYKKLLEKRFLYKILMDKNELSYIVKSSMMATSKDNKIVRLTINPENSTIVFNSKGDIISDFTDEIDIICDLAEEDTLDIAFNSTYLLDLIGNIDSQNIKIYLNDSVSPVYIENEDDPSSVYLVLPVRINR